MNKIKLLRGRAGLSLRELAEKSGVNQATISLIETDRRKAQLATLGKLAAALNVDISELLEYLDNTASSRGKAGAEAARAKRKNQTLGETIAALVRA